MTSDLEAAIPMKEPLKSTSSFFFGESRKLANSPRRYPGPAWFSGAKKHSVLLHLGALRLIGYFLVHTPSTLAPLFLLLKM